MSESDTTMPPAPAANDKLHWQDKFPLALALAAQSYVVFLWYQRSTHGIHPVVDFVIALAAGIALDWLTISTVMGRREGRTSVWSWLTSVGAFIGSATIAYDTYAVQWWPLDGKALLHVFYPLVVLLYTLHLATPKQKREERAMVQTPEQSAETPSSRAVLPSVEQPTTPFKLTDAQLVVPVATKASFLCPTCNAPLESIGELGAAKRWGHCQHCKKARTTLNHATEHKSSRNGRAPE
jgi:hypothetical protein